MEITDESWHEAISDAIDERLSWVGNRLGYLGAESIPWSEAIDSISSAGMEAFYLLQYYGNDISDDLRKEASKALAGKELTKDELRKLVTDVAMNHHVDDFRLTADDFLGRAKKSIRERCEKVVEAPATEVLDLSQQREQEKPREL